MREIAENFMRGALIGALLGLVIGGPLTAAGAPGWRGDWQLANDVRHFIETGDESDLVTWTWEMAYWAWPGDVPDKAHAGELVVRNVWGALELGRIAVTGEFRGAHLTLGLQEDDPLVLLLIGAGRCLVPVVMLALLWALYKWSGGGVKR